MAFAAESKTTYEPMWSNTTAALSTFTQPVTYYDYDYQVTFTAEAKT